GRALLEQALAPYEPLDEHLIKSIINSVYHAAVKIDEAEDTIEGNPEGLQWLLSRFGTSPHESTRHSLTGVRFFLVELLRQRGRFDEALGMAKDLLAFIKDNPNRFKPILEAVSAVCFRLLHDMKHHEAALPVCRQLLDCLQGINSPEAQQLTAHTRVMLAGLYSYLGQYNEEKKLLQELVRSPTGNPSTMSQVTMALVKLRLITLMNEADAAEMLQAFDAWFEEHRELIPLLPSEQLDTARFLREVLDTESQGKPLTPDQLRNLFRLGIKNAPAGIVSMLLFQPALFQNLQPEELRGWIGELLEARIPEEQKQLLHLYLWMTELLEDLTSETREAQTRLRQKLARVPPEFQDAFKSFLARVRTPA
ncbi:MAG: hypothetical protein ACXU86_00560, partial [Archangium sp.]